MLTINIYYKGENESARNFGKEMISSGLVDKIRSEEGNERYEYFYPLDNKETVLLIDRWKNKEALDKHHKSEMMKEISRLREKYKLSMKVEMFTEVKQ